MAVCRELETTFFFFDAWHFQKLVYIISSDESSVQH
jgi:hypothetical protein